MLNILYYGGGWPTNIGNAFIDLGAMAILKMAVPDSKIVFASEMPRWFFDHPAPEQMSKSWQLGPWRIALDSNMKKRNYSLMEQALDVASIVKCDLVVFSGMAMCEEFIRVNGPSVLKLAKRQTPVLLLGTGASDYSDEERRMYAEFLSELKPLGFISRDARSYDMFAKCVPNAWKGIDCAFFLPEAYSPPLLTLPPYVVATFDSTEEVCPNLEGRVLIRAHHECWGPIRNTFIHSGLTLVSDIPYDYLALYANADEVHSDRVHACVAALAYGRKAQFYHPTARGSLFDVVGAHDIRQQPVGLDMRILGDIKEAQVEQVRKLIKTHL